MEIKSEEYEVVGYIKKICICKKCSQVMEKKEFIPNGLDDIHQYRMKCPKCGKEELVDTNLLSDQFKLIKKVEE